VLGKTEGIILRTVDYGEGNKILTVFTKEMGKVGMMARGARKSKSRLSAVSQPFILAHFVFQIGSGMGSLSQAEIINAFPKIRLDLYRTAYAAYLLELTERFTEERRRSLILYELLLALLNQVEQGKDPEILARIFELKILSMNGYKPYIEGCSSCHTGGSPWFFSIREGGLLCSNCRYKDPHAIVLGESVPRLLQLFLHVNVAQVGNIKVKEITKRQLEKVLHLFMDEYAGVRLKSRNFLQQLNQMEEIIPRKEMDHGDERRSSSEERGMD